jgi:hypothetical protein
MLSHISIFYLTAQAIRLGPTAKLCNTVKTFNKKFPKLKVYNAIRYTIREENCTECFSRNLICYYHDFFCVGIMYSGEYDACDVTLSVYPHRQA